MALTQARGVGYRRLLDAVASSGHPCLVSGKTTLGKALVYLELGGERVPPAIMTFAGHPTDLAGPQAALRLISSPNIKLKVYLLPCRDPLDLDGFATCSTQSQGIQVVAKSLLDLRPLVGAHGQLGSAALQDVLSQTILKMAPSK
jgi:hypothetical protein